jgi:Ca2+-binding RTX toxin-like protein
MIVLYVGTTGNNNHTGSGAADYMYGDAGNDTFSGLGGIDFLRGSVGDDHLYGGSGNDFLDAGENNDVVRGDGGNDILVGLTGNDNLDGGAGNDDIFGGPGRDVLHGGAGADKFTFISTADSPASAAHDQITDFSVSSGDTIDLSSIHNFSFIGKAGFTAPWQVREGTAGGHATVEVNTSGSSGAEMVIDLNGNGTLTANDFILSGGVTGDNATHNVLLGNNAANTLHGGGGFDYLYGSAGNDKLYGEGDSDMVRGGDGDDLVDGGAGDDGLYGGAGRDTFVTSSGHDIVQDFASGEDKIQVASSTATSFSQLSVTQEAGGTLVETGHDSNSTALRAAGTADAVAPAEAADGHHDGSVFLAGIDAHHVSAADFIFG